MSKAKFISCFNLEELLRPEYKVIVVRGSSYDGSEELVQKIIHTLLSSPEYSIRSSFGINHYSLDAGNVAWISQHEMYYQRQKVVQFAKDHLSDPKSAMKKIIIEVFSDREIPEEVKAIVDVFIDHKAESLFINDSDLIKAMKAPRDKIQLVMEKGVITAHQLWLAVIRNEDVLFYEHNKRSMK
jgi:hypothetical protein